MRESLARARRLGLAAALAVTSAGAITSTSSATVPPQSRAVAPTPDVTERDVAASNEKIKAAYGALVAMWSTSFDRIGARFAPPRLVRFRGAVRTTCGTLYGDNAMYCPTQNAVYFDEVFVARQAKAAARELGTDGDMVAVGIVAHEMGHAVAIQLGEESPVPYENEAIADCLAGAFAQQAKRDGSLEPGDLEEAFFGMAAAGDPPIQLSGNRRYDARLVRVASMMGHGSRDQRQANFKTGYDGGPAACLASFR